MKLNKFIIVVGFATFFFGFAAPAILNLYLLATNSPLVLQFRSTLFYISSILGDGVILPIVNMFAASFIVKNKILIERQHFPLALFLGFLVTLYFHIVQGLLGLVNWSMPKPWQWNSLGVWHAFYMFGVSSLLFLYFLVLIRRLKKESIGRRVTAITKETFFIIVGLVIFFVLLGFDYNIL